MARTAWWASPWLAALSISASAAYGVTAAVAGAQSVNGSSEMVSTAIDGPIGSEACETPSNYMLLNAVANAWIPARFAGYCDGESRHRSQATTTT